MLSRRRSAILAVFIAFLAIRPLPALAAAPVVTQVDPSQGHLGQPDLPIKVFGQNFQNGAQVFFENPGVQVDGPVVFMNSTELDLVVDISISAALGPGDVFVINPDYSQGALPDGFTVVVPDPPVISSVFPGQGHTGDTGIAVTIQGDLLYTVDTVDFGAGIVVDSIDSITSGEIQCTISIDWMASPGSRTVSVSGPYGSDQLVDSFEVLAYPPPSVSGIIPNIGIQGETNKLLVVTGSGFFQGIDFEFQPSGNIDVTNVQYNNSNAASLTVNIHSDAGPQYYDLIATNPDGQLFILPSGFRVRPPDPIIDSVDPDHGYLGDTSLPVKILGSHLGIITTVDFGAGVTVHLVSATDTEVDVELDIDITAPQGHHDVTVSGMDLQDTLLNGFDVIEPTPEITLVVPNQAERGTQNLAVTITGEWLEGVTSVDFGPGISVSIQSVSGDQVDVLLDIQPNAPPGFRDVTVTAPNGQGTLPSGFEVLPGLPSILSVVPNQGDRGATGLAVTISGKNLDFIDSVTFGADITVNIVNAALDHVDVQLDIDPAATLGFRDVIVSGSNGQDTLVSGFQVVPGSPHIQLVLPNSALRGTTALPVTISGANLDLVDTVSFGAGITVQIVSVVLTQVDVLIDIDQLASAGFRDVTVSGLNGQDTLVSGFEVLLSQPVIQSVDPSFSVRGVTNLPVTISGDNLSQVDGVSFGAGITVNIINVAMNQVDVEIDIDPVAAPGLRDVTVTAKDLQATLPGGFEVLLGEMQISSVVPNQGYRGDTNLPVTIYGQNLDVVDTVSFGEGIAVTIVSTALDRVDVEIDIDLLAAAGPRDVGVFWSDTGYTLAGGFEVLIRPPDIQSVVPNQAMRGTVGLDVTVSGNWFEPGATLDFGQGIVIDAMNVADSQTINATISILAEANLGPRDVVVMNPDSQSDTLPEGFLVTAQPIIPPEIMSLDPPYGYLGDSDYHVTIHGANFQDGIVVEFENPGIQVTSTDFVSQSMLNVTIDIDMAAVVGATDVRVTNPDLGSDVLVDGFLVNEAIRIESIEPSQAYQGDTVPFEIRGWGFKTGAEVTLVPDVDVDISIQVVSFNSIQGTMVIDPSATPGVYDVRVTNLDGTMYTLFHAFEILEKVIPLPPPEVTGIVPNQVCIGESAVPVMVTGANFRDGASVTFEQAGAPSSDIYDFSVTFIDASSIRVVLSVRADAPEGAYDVRVENPDGQYAYGPQLHVVDCIGKGHLEWQEPSLEALIEVRSAFSRTIEHGASVMLLNTGNGSYANVVVSMTDLTASDGRAITPEHEEVYPSIVGPMGPGEKDEIGITLTLPVGGDLLPPGQSSTFQGYIVAEDTITGDIARLPVTVTVVVPQPEMVEIDPRCLQVSLIRPGAPASGTPEIFRLDRASDASTSLGANLGGCETQFPTFEWDIDAEGCPGYLEKWDVRYTVSVYPVYPAQSMDEAVQNLPVWRGADLTETSIQYPATAEALDGYFVWQVEVTPVARPDVGVAIGPSTTVASEIWLFCVNRPVYATPRIAPELAWMPSSLTMESGATATATLVISKSLAGRIRSNTPASLIVSEVGTGEILSVPLDLATIEFREVSTLPNFGQAAIDFEIWLVSGEQPTSPVVLRITNGAVLLGEVALVGAGERGFEIKATIADSSATLPLQVRQPAETGSNENGSDSG